MPVASHHGDEAVGGQPEGGKNGERREDQADQQRPAQHPGLLAERIGLVRDADGHRAAGGRHRGVEAQGPAGQKPGQADARGHRQAIFDMDAEQRQRPASGHQRAGDIWPWVLPPIAVYGGSATPYSRLITPQKTRKRGRFVPQNPDRQSWRNRLPHHQDRPQNGHRHGCGLFRRRPRCSACEDGG